MAKELVSSAAGPGMPEVLLAAHIVVLENAYESMDAHLARGESFIEVASWLLLVEICLTSAGKEAKRFGMAFSKQMPSLLDLALLPSNGNRSAK